MRKHSAVLGLALACASTLGAQEPRPLSPLELPEGLVIACRAVPVAEVGPIGEAMVPREFVFTSDSSSAVLSRGRVNPVRRSISVLFDSAGTAFMLVDTYQDTAGVSTWTVGRDTTGAYIGFEVVTMLADVLANELSPPDTAAPLATGDSLRVERVSEWLWQRRCGKTPL